MGPSLPEKDVNVDQLENSIVHVPMDDSDKANDALIAAFTPEEQKKILWRVDRRLVTTLGALYCASLMDRINTGLAVIAGMGVDLDLVGARYSIIVLVFFITYVLLQPVATVVLRKVGPRVFLPTICLLWGTTMICFGFVKHWYDLVPLRLVLGIFEAGFFNGCVYLLSCWYTRYELQTRNTTFYIIGTFAQAFTGILAYGFSQLKNHGTGPVWWGQHYGSVKTPDTPPGIMPGIAGWRWIFILQGVLTCLAALVSFLFIVDFPELAHHSFGLRFLNKNEVDFIVARIEKDRNDVLVEDFILRKYLKNALDLKIWGFAALFGLATTNAYAIAYFLPIILNDGMGFNVAASQCLIAPPYVVAAIIMYLFAYWGDRYHIRSPFILFSGCILLIGLPLVGYVENVGVRYFGVFIATTGCNAVVPVVLTWQANNIRGQWKRALCSATVVGAGGVGGIIGGTVFRSQDKPSYHPGILTCMIASALIILITLALDLKFYRANKRVEAGGKPIEGLAGFTYTY